MTADNSADQPSYWPHAPIHLLSGAGVYFVTARTYQQEHHFAKPERLAVLHRGLLKQAIKFGWHLEAWAVFSNHYHFIGRSPEDDIAAGSLQPMLRELHSKTARWINALDGAPGRKVWCNYWDTRLTYMPSYLARLKYVHTNAVKHKLVHIAAHYPWCSAAWFERTASQAQVHKIYKQKIDNLRLEDEFEPVLERDLV